MYTIRDLVYDNRWVTMSDGEIVKFTGSIAKVADKHVEFFKSSSDFVIVGHELDEFNKIRDIPKEDVVKDLEEINPEEVASVHVLVEENDDELREAFKLPEKTIAEDEGLKPAKKKTSKKKE